MTRQFLLAAIAFLVPIGAAADELMWPLSEQEHSAPAPVATRDSDIASIFEGVDIAPDSQQTSYWATTLQESSAADNPVAVAGPPADGAGSTRRTESRGDEGHLGSDSGAEIRHAPPGVRSRRRLC